jgi:hypothetical protein
MADYVVLKLEADGSWGTPRVILEKTATEAGASEAAKESYTGPGTYCVLRLDNAIFLEQVEGEPTQGTRTYDAVASPSAEA